MPAAAQLALDVLHDPADIALQSPQDLAHPLELPVASDLARAECSSGAEAGQLSSCAAHHGAFAVCHHNLQFGTVATIT